VLFTRRFLYFWKFTYTVNMRTSPFPSADDLVTTVAALVALHPKQTVADLRARLGESGHDVSLQHVYRLVARLMEEGIVVKEGKTLSANLLWISELEHFLDRSKEAARNAAKKDDGLPLKLNERRTFACETLSDVQALWNHLLVRLYTLSPEKYLFKYYAHAWWQIGPHPLERDFYKKIKEKGLTCFWLYGNDSPVDRAISQEFGDLVEMRVTDAPPFPSEGYNLNVYGEYVVECNLPPVIMQHFALLFRTVENVDEARKLAKDTFALKAPYTITVWRNPKQAALLRKKIEFQFLKPKR